MAIKFYKDTALPSNPTGTDDGIYFIKSGEDMEIYVIDNGNVVSQPDTLPYIQPTDLNGISEQNTAFFIGSGVQNHPTGEARNGIGFSSWGGVSGIQWASVNGSGAFMRTFTGLNDADYTPWIQIADRDWIDAQNFATVSELFSGDYNDLTNKPNIPDVNNNTIVLSANGALTGGGNFNLNQSSNKQIPFGLNTNAINLENLGNVEDVISAGDILVKDVTGWVGVDQLQNKWNLNLTKEIPSNYTVTPQDSILICTGTGTTLTLFTSISVGLSMVLKFVIHNSIQLTQDYKDTSGAIITAGTTINSGALHIVSTPNGWQQIN